MPPPTTPLSKVLPPLICGTATFNTQYNADPLSMPTNAIIARALELGINAFDTSPYYGPSETLLGDALKASGAPRSSYHLLTKVGRVGPEEFNYSPAWIRQSVARSLERLHTTYLDVVYCHDCEFVRPAQTLAAIRELRALRDEGKIRYVGISGYPVPLLVSLAEQILTSTGEPVDAVQSYANFTLQNTTLESVGKDAFYAAGVSVVTNASVLGMGLLRGVGVPGPWHPAPPELGAKIGEVAAFLAGKGEKLEVVAIRWALGNWARNGAPGRDSGVLGVSVMGVSTLGELEETVRVWRSVLDGMQGEGEGREESLRRGREVDGLVEEVWGILGKWRGFAWASPDEGFVKRFLS